MQYRTHDDGPLTTISIEPGAVIVTMEFDQPCSYTRLHSHAFDHWMTCIKGRARIVIDDALSTINAGDRYMVEAHKKHGVWPDVVGTVLECRHEHADIHPDKKPMDGIPLEWLYRLTEQA